MNNGCRSLVIQSPTGSGKTALTAEMVKRSLSKGFRSWFIVHRRELVKQASAAFFDAGVPHGTIAAGFIGDRGRPTQVCSIGSLRNSHRELMAPKLIIWDECHHIGAKSWAEIFRAHPQAFHIGLTATPERLDGKGLGTWFKEMVRGPSVQSLITSGYLSRYRLYAPPSVSMAGVHVRAGDFVRAEVGALLDKPTITGSAIAHYKQHALGKRAVVFAVSVEHSKHIVAGFQAAGIPSAHVDGETDIRERDAAVRMFQGGRIKILSNVELFGEGFDLPAIECGILLRPTQSLALYLQQLGRTLRTHPGKDEAIILDHAGNTERHGLPDEDREWTLEDRIAQRGGKKDNGQSVKVCPSCFRAQFAGRATCQFCGTAFEIKARKVAEIDGELVEIDPAKARAAREAARDQSRHEQHGARSLEDLVELAKRRNYKRPHLWARHVFRARRAGGK